MDYVKLVYSVLLLISGIWMFVVTSSKKGDERKKYIAAKAQSYSFIVVIGFLILEVVESIYRTFQGTDSSGISPLIFMTMISLVYVITLVIYRKKFGD